MRKVFPESILTPEAFGVMLCQKKLQSSAQIYARVPGPAASESSQ